MSIKDQYYLDTEKVFVKGHHAPTSVSLKMLQIYTENKIDQHVDNYFPRSVLLSTKEMIQNFAVKPLASGLWLYAQAYLDGALIINLNTAPLYKIHDYNYNNFRISSHFPENLEQRGT